MESSVLDLVILLRVAYLGAALLILFISFVPALRNRFLDYGARSSDSSVRHAPQSKRDASAFSKILDLAAGLKVPHSWFVSFYAISVSCSLFWASALLSRSFALSLSAKAASGVHDSMTLHQIIVAWLLMFVQGSRRLYECLTLSTPSDSQMWIGHWIMGAVFYVATSMAIWIEGVDSGTLSAHKVVIHHFVFTGPSIRTFLASTIFILASGLQHDCHAYLASLKKSGLFKGGRSVTAYRFPSHPAFNMCLTPHYFAECLIYVALTIQAAPTGSSLNWTLACASVFVMINLGVTAHGTREWYKTRFGSDAIRGKSRMIPFIY